MEKLSLTAANHASQFAALPAQVGSLFFAAGTVLPPNSHTQDEISFIHSGVLKTISGGQSEIVRGGDVTFIPAGEIHEAEVLEDVRLSYVLLERS